MKEIKNFGMAVLFALGIGVALIGPLWALSAVSGTSTDVGSLWAVGQEFTCEWVSSEGTTTVLVTDSGRRRLVDVPKHYVEVGKRYRYKTQPTG